MRGAAVWTMVSNLLGGVASAVDISERADAQNMSFELALRIAASLASFVTKSLSLRLPPPP